MVLTAVLSTVRMLSALLGLAALAALHGEPVPNPEGTPCAAA